MKPLKLLACLVTLQFLGSLPLLAAEPHPLRTWTDLEGRQITARLVVSPAPAGSVRIMRDDGQMFTVELNRFSQADRDYVRKATAKGDDKLTDISDEQWRLMRRAGNHPAVGYVDTALNEIIEEINQRLRIRKVTTEQGEPMSIRTEPAALAEQLKINGQLASMDTADFLKRIAYNYNLAVKVDSTGSVVLVDKTASAISGGLFGMGQE